MEGFINAFLMYWILKETHDLVLQETSEKWMENTPYDDLQELIDWTAQGNMEHQEQIENNMHTKGKLANMTICIVGLSFS